MINSPIKKLRIFINENSDVLKQDFIDFSYVNNNS